MGAYGRGARVIEAAKEFRDLAYWLEQAEAEMRALPCAVFNSRAIPG